MYRFFFRRDQTTKFENSYSRYGSTVRAWRNSHPGQPGGGGEASRPSYRVRGDGHPRPAWGMNLDGYATLSVRAGGRGIPTSLGSLPPLHSGSIPRGDPFSQGGPRWPRWLPPLNYLPIVPLHPFMEGDLNLMKQHRFR